MQKRRVVITGMGTINALALNVNDFWDSLLLGKSGISQITKFDTDGYPATVAGEIKNYDPTQYFDRKESRKLDLFAQYGIAAATDAMEHSCLLDAKFDPTRVGVITGVGIGGMMTLEEEVVKLHQKGPRRISPFFIPKMISNIVAAHISIKYNLQAINFNVVSACASANHAIGTAMRTIQYGDADVILAGGTEAAITPAAVGGFCSMKALSTRNELGPKACSPFDIKRDGFVMSEGAGILVLEELEHARGRGANIIAELVGYSATADAYHITAPRSDGNGGSRACTNALADAGIAPHEVDYFNAHGTSTPLNDAIETVAIKNVFGEHAKNLLISSTKSMLGHTLGAAGAIESIVCCQTIKTGKIHPTINIDDPDPACDLNYVPHGVIEKDVKIAVSNSLGFGGQNSVLVFKKY